MSPDGHIPQRWWDGPPPTKRGRKRGRYSRAKGARFETDLVKWLKARGNPAAKHNQRIKDNRKPDVQTAIAGHPLRVECKSVRGMPSAPDLAALVQAEGATDGIGTPVAIIKVPGKGTGQAVVLLRLDDFARLLEERGGGK